MRVLMLSWEYPPHIVGGLGKHVAELAPALAGFTLYPRRSWRSGWFSDGHQSSPCIMEVTTMTRISSTGTIATDTAAASPSRWVCMPK